MYTFFGALAFIIWGLVPVYFHQLEDFSPALILSNRIFWSAVILVTVFCFKPNLIDKKQCTARNISIAFMAGIMMNLSWLGFVYATITNNIMAASLAFYITPVFVFFMGFVFFKERLKSPQKIALFLMVLAIVSYVYLDQQLPILSLAISLSFASYIAIKKLIKLNTFGAIFFEHILFAPIALWYIMTHSDSLLLVDFGKLMGTAPLQLVSILLLSISILKTPLSKISLLQYIEPTFHLALALWVYHEPISLGQKSALIIVIISIMIASLKTRKKITIENANKS
ncbi:EamA family transporter [Aliivibrio fischeri]|uniref:EamA family transporter n=1 Tax=Aliivibrio fischeri TaxID=668 RepID=UPI0012DA4BEE|nr:EamA family transporter [Aliivibrio fischeri]MUJ36646.1 EamA family transporter [Aliivibrio fischeri]